MYLVFKDKNKLESVNNESKNQKIFTIIKNQL